ncbi:MAG: PIG-L family deacetylase [archaeon]
MRNIMIFAPHMDDEAVGCGGLIIKAAREQSKITIVYMIKDEVRKEEAKNIMTRLGIQAKLIFMDYKKLNDKNALLDAIKKVTDLIKKETPTEIYIPSYEGGHLQHDLTNFIVKKAVNTTKNTQTYEYPLYNNYPIYLPIKMMRRYTSKHLPFRTGIFPPLFIPEKTKTYVLEMNNGDMKIKRAMIRGYKSQNAQDYLVKNFLYEDRFRKCPRYDYTKRPHEILPLNYEMVNRGKFKDFREAINI